MMVEKAAAAGAWGVKLQKRSPRDLLDPQEYSASHPEPAHAFGTTYGEHREALELPIDDLKVLRDKARSMGLKFGCSVFDMTSAEQVAGIFPDFMKIGSGQNTRFDIMRYIRRAYEGPVHISLGMIDWEEKTKLRDFWKDDAGRVVWYLCTSGYPIQPKEACLKELFNIRYYKGQTMSGLGYSGHHTGVVLDVIAYAYGAEYIERHFTLDKTMKGTDQAMSLEPDDLARLVENLKDAQDACNYKYGILPVEKPVRERLKWSAA
jgi:N-acetylneuraminate synthase